MKSADVCSDVRLLETAFNLCNLNLMACGAQFPMAAFMEERENLDFSFFYLPPLPLSLRRGTTR